MILARTFVTIIIPTYDRALLVCRAIESALAQRDVDPQVVVVDDGSTDDTAQRVSAFGTEIEYVWQPNAGVAAARNAGLRLARGEFVLFLDSDDTVTADKCRIQSEALRAVPAASVAYSRWRSHRFWEATPRVSGVDFSGAELATLLCRNLAVIHACLFRLDAVRAVGGFDERLLRCEDWDLLLRLALDEGGFVFTEAVTADYYKHRGSKSNDQQLALDCALRIVRRARAHPCIPPRFVERHESLEAIQYLEAMRRCILQGDEVGAEAVADRLRGALPAAAATLLPSCEPASRHFAPIDARKLRLIEELGMRA